jgi:hypothetical protein
LKIIDKSGDFRYSNIIAIQVSKQNSWVVSVQPNPFKESIVVQTLLEKDERLSFKILNSNGDLLYQNSLMVSANHSSTVLKVPSQWAVGTYILQIVGNNKQISTKLIKQ